MEKITIERTEKTPYVNFEEGLIEIKGRSILEDSVEFYTPLIKWIENYIKHPSKKTQVIFEIEYSNSNSNKFFFQIISLLEKCYLNNNDISITWRFENDDDAIKDLGFDLKSLTKIPFNMEEI
jgi:hypothetical protein